jgi:hypothetical protein
MIRSQPLLDNVDIDGVGRLGEIDPDIQPIAHGFTMPPIWRLVDGVDR